MKQKTKKTGTKKVAKKVATKLTGTWIMFSNVLFDTVKHISTKVIKANGNLTFNFSVNTTKKFPIKGKQTNVLKFRLEYIPKNIATKKPAHVLIAETGYKISKKNAQVHPYALGVLNKLAKYHLDSYKLRKDYKVILSKIK
jgi:hypothetical protein